MSTFLIPGTGEDRQLAERACTHVRAALKLWLGTRPSLWRIAKLWTRRAGADCVTEVVMTDPRRGGIVVAIFDMGERRPFVVWRPHGGRLAGVPEILDHAYSVVEFDA